MLQLLLILAAASVGSPAVAQPVLDWPVLGKVVGEFAPDPPESLTRKSGRLVTL